MQTLGINLPAEAVKLAVAKTSWPGRLQVLQQSPLVYYDVGHNPSAAKAVSEFFQGLFPARKIRILMGLVQDKDAEGFIDNIATIASDFTFTDLPTPRSRNPRDLERIAKSKPLPTRVIQNPREALEKIIAETAREDIILVIGSHYLGEPILSLYKNFRKKS
jgi:dihydrofolate synthase/folylpolyglutamate synthase